MTQTMNREELTDEIWEAMDDANDMDVGLRDLAKAVVRRLEKIGAVDLEPDPESADQKRAREAMEARAAR